MENTCSLKNGPVPLKTVTKEKPQFHKVTCLNQLLMNRDCNQCDRWIWWGGMTGSD